MREKTTVDYDLTSGGPYELSLQLDEETTTELLAGLVEEIRQMAEQTRFAETSVYLYYEITTQILDQNGLTPWHSRNDSETANVVIESGEWEYEVLFQAIRNRLDRNMTPSQAKTGLKLFLLWADVVEQVAEQADEFLDYEHVLDDLDNTPPTPRRSEERYSGDLVGMQELLDGTVVEEYETPAGDTFYKCTDCETSYAEVGDEHDCPDGGAQ